MTRIFNIISWLGIALVLAAFGVRVAVSTGHSWHSVARGLPRRGWGSPASSSTLPASGARSPVSWNPLGPLRHARRVSLLIVLGIIVATNYIGKKQNKRWDFTASGQFSLSDQSRNVVLKLDAP
jgi:hypothetical protein